MEGKPARQEHDLDRHGRHGAPRCLPIKRQRSAGENIALSRAAMGQDRLAGALHMRRIDVVAAHLQREIGFDAGAHIERPVVKERPAAMRPLDAAQIVAELCLKLEVRRFAEEVDEQDVFGRDGAIRLELEDEVPIGPLHSKQGLGGAGNAMIQRGGTDPARGVLTRVKLQSSDIHHFIPGAESALFLPITRSAAELPERTAPSSVAGSPVCVQSPASTRFAQFVAAAGRLLSCSGVAEKVARRSLTICHGGMSGPSPAISATSLQISAARLSRGMSMSRSAPLIVTDRRSGKAKSHSTSPFTTPCISGMPAGGVTRKWALTMALNSDGTLISGISITAKRAGTARITASSGASVICASPKSSSVTRSSSRVIARSRRSRRTLPPCSSIYLRAGSTKALDRPSVAISGRQASPPFAKVSRTTAPASCAEASAGSILSAANKNGRPKLS